ncbi:MAG TPA: Rid family hydrolase [Pyrinomonadaceae bacterium]
MPSRIQTLTPSNLPSPLGPYSHIARAGQLITISAIAGMDPESGKIVSADAYSQAKQILRLCDVMLEAAGSDFAHVVHVNVFLKNMEHLEEVSRAYDDVVGAHGPAGTVVAVSDLPKRDALVTMSLTAVAHQRG